MITSNIAFYPCVSIEETERFYRDIIGLELVFSDGKARIFSAVKGHFGFVEYADKTAAVGRLCLSLNCASETDVDAEYERLVSIEAYADGRRPSLHAPRKHEHFPVYSFFIKDPNGYFVEFQKIRGVDI